MVLHGSPETGASATTRLLTLHTHSGTHLDLPGHFCTGTTSFPIGGEMTYFPCHVREIPVREGDPLTVAQLRSAVGELSEGAALLIRTGAQAWRDADPDRYALSHAWVDPGVPTFLRARLPRLALFGIDAISVSIPGRKAEGRDCHRAFLCGSPPILLLEDADLSDPRLLSGPWRLHVFPYLAEDLDGIPVVAIAESDEEVAWI